MPRSPRTTICVSSRALTITGRRAANVSDGIVDLALGQGFLIFGQLADLVADLLGEHAQAKPRGQHASRTRAWLSIGRETSLRRSSATSGSSVLAGRPTRLVYLAREPIAHLLRRVSNGGGRQDRARWGDDGAFHGCSVRWGVARRKPSACLDSGARSGGAANLVGDGLDFVAATGSPYEAAR
jgi:hypothetical protein